MCREMYYKLTNDENFKKTECEAWNKMQAENACFENCQKVKEKKEKEDCMKTC